MAQFDITKLLQELDAGILASKLSEICKDTALATVTHRGKGVVTLELKLEQIGESNQVQMHHKISYTKPTLRGKAGEESTTSTALYVAGDGAISIMPDTQMGMFREEN